MRQTFQDIACSTRVLFLLLVHTKEREVNQRPRPDNKITNKNTAIFPNKIRASPFPRVVSLVLSCSWPHSTLTTLQHMVPPPQIMLANQSHATEAVLKAHQSTAATPTVSFTPTDVNIPSSLYDKVPNLDLYKKLQDAEKELDLLIAQKGLDFQSVQADSAQKINRKGETGVLRVFVYNTCENMPWQRKQGVEMSDDATWTLKIEGRYISDDKSSKAAAGLRFSSLVSGVSVELVPNGDYPNLQNNNGNIIEWREPAANGMPNSVLNPSAPGSFDGIDIRRPGVFNINLKIAILVKDFSEKCALSPQMAQFTGRREASQKDVVYQIWQYVLFKNLFRKASTLTNVPAVSASEIADSTMNLQGKDDKNLSTIRCDPLLKELLEVDCFKFRDLYKLVMPHMRPREPIIIDYEVITTKSTTLGDLVLDIPIELPSFMSEAYKELVAENKATFESMTKSDEHIKFLNLRIALGISALQSVNARELFYRELSEDPVRFMKAWLESQAETLKALKSEEGYNEETVRRASFFKENEELLKQKIDLMLGAQKL